MRKAASDEFWPPWILSFTTVALGLIAGFALVRRWRGAATLLTVSSVLYIVAWSMTSGALSSDLTLPALFRDMWTLAVRTGTEAMYWHRNVVLLTLFVVLTVVGGIATVANLKRRAHL
jgi:formate-dependent nitrite reductase membrane component NrfD